MNRVELAKKKLEVKTMDHQIAQFDFRILEKQDEIERVKEQIEICEKRKVALLEEIKEQGE